MSGDIESLLRRGLAEVAEGAPGSYDDAGLATAAIQGAGRIRRRRRVVGAAASGASLLVLSAAVIVWQPWMDIGNGDNAVIAADTSTTEAQVDLAMEFLVEDRGRYSILNEDGDMVSLAVEEPPTQVFRLADSYVYETWSEVGVTSLDGSTGVLTDKESDVRLTVNSAGTEYSLATPREDYTKETYLLNAAVDGAEEYLGEFTTSYDLTLQDWTDSTTVFSADLRSTTGQDGMGTYHFNLDMEWGLETVGQAGFASAVITDANDPEFVCVSDLDPGVNFAPNDETCGEVDSPPVQEALFSAGADAEMVASSVENLRFNFMMPPAEIELGDYEDRFLEAEGYWPDPFGRWQITGAPGDRTWLLIDNVTGEGPFLAELAVPEGAIMPVYSAL